MNRLLLLFLLIGFGFDVSFVKADPIAPNITDSATKETLTSPNRGHGVPSNEPVGDFDSKPRVKELKSSGVKVKGRLLGNPDNSIGKVVPSPTKTKGDPKTVGDFGPLPTNSYKQKNHNGSPPNPSDFQSAPVESGSGNRRAK